MLEVGSWKDSEKKYGSTCVFQKDILPLQPLSKRSIINVGEGHLDHYRLT